MWTSLTQKCLFTLTVHKCEFCKRKVKKFTQHDPQDKMGGVGVAWEEKS